MPSTLKKTSHAHAHPSHEGEIARLNRAIGQLEGIKRMLEDKRYCTDILMQTRAATAAIKAIETSILEKHLRHCVHAAMTSRNKDDAEEKITELVALYDRRG